MLGRFAVEADRLASPITPAAAQAFAEELRAAFSNAAVPTAMAQQAAREILTRLISRPYNRPDEQVFELYRAIAVAFDIEAVELKVSKAGAAELSEYAGRRHGQP